MEERRKIDGAVSQAEFMDYKDETAKYRVDMHRRLDDIHVALFAKDNNNANDQPGVMVTMKRLDGHIDSVCNIARWSWQITLGFCSLIASAAVTAHQMGWL